MRASDVDIVKVVYLISFLLLFVAVLLHFSFLGLKVRLFTMFIHVFCSSKCMYSTKEFRKTAQLVQV